MVWRQISQGMVCGVLLAAAGCRRPAVQTSWGRPVTDLVGIWLDETDNIATTIALSGDVPTVIKVVDRGDGEVFSVLQSNFADGVLTYQFKVPSTGWTIEWTVRGMTPDLLRLQADYVSAYDGQTRAEGQEFLVRQ